MKRWMIALPLDGGIFGCLIAGGYYGYAWAENIALTVIWFFGIAGSILLFVDAKTLKKKKPRG